MPLSFDEFVKKGDELFSDGYKKLKEAISYLEEGSFEKAELRFEDARIAFKKLLELTNELVHEAGRKSLRITVKSFGLITTSFVEAFLDVTESLHRVTKKLK